MNYNDEQVAYMTKTYQEEPTRETVENLAEELDKSVKSIIGKLSREGVYKRTYYKTKTGENPVTKLEIVESIAGLLGVKNLEGLEKSPKPTLKELEKCLKQLLK
jgi:N-methylhydantoinase B/oxoprolinase/acetone carboxylase alpha subunit